MICIYIYNLYACLCLCIILSLSTDESDDAVVPSLPSLPPYDPTGIITSKCLKSHGNIDASLPRVRPPE